MAIAWYIVPYKRRPMPPEVVKPIPIRYCAMDDYTKQIVADGGKWSECEVLGNRAVVKVKASDSTIAILDGVFRRIPGTAALDRKLSDLTTSQKNAVRSELQDMGYTLTEIQSKLGSNIGNKTLGDLLRFIMTRTLKPRYDVATDAIMLDGEERPCPKSLKALDGEVS